MEPSHSILIVDDDPRICRLLKLYLEKEGYRTHAASSGGEMHSRLSESHIDLILLDVRLPDIDGFTLVKELSSLPNVSVIMITGKSDPLYKVLGLELGADDYVTKPFDKKGAAGAGAQRSAARCKRQAPAPARALRNPRPLCGVGTRSRRPGAHFSASSPLFLTTREFQLLAALTENPQRVLSRDFILDSLAGRDWAPEDRSIDVLIGKLRRKLGDNAQHPKLIKTVRGVGYKLSARVHMG